MTKAIISAAAVSLVLLAVLSAAAFMPSAIPVKKDSPPGLVLRSGETTDPGSLTPDISIEFVYAHTPYEVLPEDYVFIDPGMSRSDIFCSTELKAIANAKIQQTFLDLLGKCVIGDFSPEEFAGENAFTVYFGAFSQPYYVSSAAVFHKEMLNTGEYVNVCYRPDENVGQKIYDLARNIFVSASRCSVSQDIASIGDASRPMSRLIVSFNPGETFTQLFLKDEFYPLTVGAEDILYYYDTLSMVSLIFDSIQYGVILTPSRDMETVICFKDAENALLHLFDSIVAPAASLGNSGCKNDNNTIVFYFCTDGSSSGKISKEIDILTNNGADSLLGSSYPELAYIILRCGKPALCFSENSLETPPITENYNYWYE